MKETTLTLFNQESLILRSEKLGKKINWTSLFHVSSLRWNIFKKLKEVQSVFFSSSLDYHDLDNWEPTQAITTLSILFYWIAQNQNNSPLESLYFVRQTISQRCASVYILGPFSVYILFLHSDTFSGGLLFFELFSILFSEIHEKGNKMFRKRYKITDSHW